MPPHCDAIDGPVALAAFAALEQEDVEVVLPFVDGSDEAEVRSVFDRVADVRATRGTVRDVADRYFVETVVRLHRRSEGAPFTGLKPAGLDVGPVIPLAEAAIATGSPDELIQELAGELEDAVKTRLDRVLALKVHAGEDVARAREYTRAMLGLQVWSHRVHRAIVDEPHG